MTAVLAAESMLLFWSLRFALVALAIGMAASVYRLVRGPTLPDRVVALDLVGTLAASAVAVYAIATERSILVSVAMVLALTMFVSTVAFALYLERRARP